MGPLIWPSLLFCLYPLRHTHTQIFLIFCLPCCLCLSKNLPPQTLLGPCGRVRQGEMGWGRVSQVNRLKSAGEAQRVIVCACVCVCTLSKFGTSAQSYVSEVAPSVALIFPSVCCHVSLRPPKLFHFPPASDTSCRTFPVLSPSLSAPPSDWFVPFYTKEPLSLTIPPFPLECLTPLSSSISLLTHLFFLKKKHPSFLYQLSLAPCHPCPSGLLPLLPSFPSPTSLQARQPLLLVISLSLSPAFMLNNSRSSSGEADKCVLLRPGM